MRVRRVLLVAVTALAAATFVAAGPAQAAAQTVRLSPTGSVLITAKGNGHGHGMSQYGALGAAQQRHGYAYITHFYYPHTTLSTLRWSMIRVRLSGFGQTVTVASVPGLTVSSLHGSIGYRGVAKWRLVVGEGSGLTLQYQRTTSPTWITYLRGLRNGAYFRPTNHWATTRTYRPDGSSRDYYGKIMAFRTTAYGPTGSVFPVNRLTLDKYTAGVVPRESPASWLHAAVESQAVAARTYGRYAVEHPRSASYDICDTTSCQVYGGHAAHDSAGRFMWSDYMPASVATANKVLTYGGRAIFAQFSASDGGYAISGGQPYLVTQADPFDYARGTNPYYSYTRTVSVSSLARSLGLATVTAVTITSRDGHSTWGGRVLAGYVDGTDSAHHAKRVSVSGYDLQWALGLGTTWFTLAAR